MLISVIVPTYRRAEDLRRCLAAVTGQRQAATEVLVVARADDAESRRAAAESAAGVRVVTVEEPGVIAAMNAGLAAAGGELVLLTDDDAAPWPDWIERIEQAFVADPRLGVLGGKDWQFHGPARTPDVGVETRSGALQWHGRMIGMHHWAAAGPAREVTVVKGVNMAVRAEALRAVGGFDERLAGTGAQVHWELALCLAIRRAGWKVVFDPSLGVDHFPAPRFDEDQRNHFDEAAQRNMVFNETLVLAEHFSPLRRTAFAIWATAVGTRGAPGLVQLLRARLNGRENGWQRFVATMRGRVGGFRAASAGGTRR